MSALRVRLDALAASGRAPRLALALGLALTLPGLFGGFALDDQFQRLVLAGSASTVTTFGVMDRLARGLAVPRRTYVLSSGGAPIEVYREDATSLVVEARAGSLVHVIDRLFRDTGHAPLRAGQELEFSGLRIKVLAVTGDGWPQAARFSFLDPAPLEARAWRTRRGFRVVPLLLPAIGERRPLEP